MTLFNVSFLLLSQYVVIYFRGDMEKSAQVEIIIIGNEILTGDILDTNTNWLNKFIHNRGGSVNRVTVVPDNLDIIAQTVRDSVNREVDIIFTSGGLGPTSDDLTLQAVAKGTDREARLHPKAREMVRKQYDFFFEQGIMTEGGLNPARETMAYLPEGAEPLANPVGTAPGVILKLKHTTIISVPGVPSELQTIIEQPLHQFFADIFGDGNAISRTVAVRCNDESMLEAVLTGITGKYPQIYTKSLATTLGEKPEMDIIMTVAGVGEKETILTKAFGELCRGIEKLGFSIRQK